MRQRMGLFVAMALTAGSVYPLNGHAQTRAPDEVVASVDGVKYLRKDLDKTVETIFTTQNYLPDKQAEVRPMTEKQFITRFVNVTLLKNEAAREGITVTDEERKKGTERFESILHANNMTLEQHFRTAPIGEENARRDLEDSFLVEKLTKVKVLDLIQIDDAEVENILNAAKAQNAEIEKANANVADTKAAQRKKIEDIKKQLEAGADFAKLAKEYSECPSSQNGGDLGTFRRGMMAKPFEDAAFGQEIGKVGEIVETQFGYHLILVTAKTPAVAATAYTPATPETVAASHILVMAKGLQPPRPVPTADDIRERLKRQRADPALRAYMSGLKAKAKIETIVPID
ncbi:MAG: peptidylprolyl isomerase [Kiritimatiellaeota bacterium]|nr:peptidylprolyl isomerase [Kiritimatiellota bacterium]